MLSPSSNPRLFLQGCSGTTRTLTGTGVGASALTTHGQTMTVAHAAVGSQIDQALDRKLYFTTQVAFDRKFTDLLADALQLAIGKVLHLLVVFDAGCFANLASARTTNTKDGGKSDFGVFLRRNGDASNTGHDCSLLVPLRSGVSLDAACGGGRCR